MIKSGLINLLIVAALVIYEGRMIIVKTRELVADGRPPKWIWGFIITQAVMMLFRSVTLTGWMSAGVAMLIHFGNRKDNYPQVEIIGRSIVICAAIWIIAHAVIEGTSSYRVNAYPLLMSVIQVAIPLAIAFFGRKLFRWVHDTLGIL